MVRYGIFFLFVSPIPYRRPFSLEKGLWEGLELVPIRCLPQASVQSFAGGEADFRFL